METIKLILIISLCVNCLQVIGSIGAITYLKEKINSLEDELKRNKGIGSGVGPDSSKEFRYQDRSSSCESKCLFSGSSIQRSGTVKNMGK